MKIALCYEHVIPARGGMEVLIADLARRLVADRHEVHLYAYERDAAALPSEVIFHALIPGWGPRFLRPWRFAAACEKALRREQHDVVVGFVKTWFQDVYIAAGGLHVATASHNLRKYRQPWLRGLAHLCQWLSPAYWSYVLLERKQFCGQHRPVVVAVSRMVEEHFRTHYALGSEQVKVIHNAVDPDRFLERDRLKLRSELREQLRIRPDDPVGLFVAHNYRLKGLEPLLHAVRALPPGPFQLIVCGNPQDRAFSRLARKLGVSERVHFLGYRAAVRQCFFAADFLVHPTFYDPCSLVVPEALACGLPVITSRCNGAAELMNPPAEGFVVDDPHDHEQLARHIAALCDPRVRSECSRAAQRAAARWTLEDQYQALLATFQEVAQRKQRAAA
jgi:UDP-glucose:(heptosyl)LPS alpha-1,3-glucosyltransferase